MDTRTHFNTYKYEMEADTFAMHLLIGDDVLVEYENYTIDQISHLMGYQKDLIELRLKGR